MARLVERRSQLETSKVYDLEEDIRQMFEEAGFNIMRMERIGNLEIGDFSADRVEFGRVRRYAVDVKYRLSLREANRAVQRFRSYVRASKIPFRNFDEFWLVAKSVSSEARTIQGEYARQFRILDVDELRKLLAPYRPRRSPPKGKARTKIGKAVEANQKSIQLAIAALMLQVDGIIERLGQEHPNSEESIAALRGKISEYEGMRTQLENIRSAVTKFVKGQEKEKEIVKAVATFKDTIASWWAKSHVTICDNASAGGLFVGSTGLLHLMNADSVVAVAIAGTVFGGETVVKALKALPRKLF